jgi:hypothetical protein
MRGAAAAPRHPYGVEITVRLTLWSPRHKERTLPADPSVVERTLRDIADEWSADLFLVKDAVDVGGAVEWMGISASHGRYLVTAAKGRDEFYDLIGDPAAAGEAEDFAYGGQEAAWPLRRLVSVDEAMAVARYYIETGRLRSDRLWQRQE